MRIHIWAAIFVVLYVSSCGFSYDDIKPGKLVGEDKYGNKYFENPYYFYGRNRWIEFSEHVRHEYDASQIPAEWYGWMHYKVSTYNPLFGSTKHLSCYYFFTRLTFLRLVTESAPSTNGWLTTARICPAPLSNTLRTQRLRRKSRHGSHQNPRNYIPACRV